MMRVLIWADVTKPFCRGAGLCISQVKPRVKRGEGQLDLKAVQLRCAAKMCQDKFCRINTWKMI